MSTNCLVTKLKESVNNVSLTKIGAFHLGLHSTSVLNNVCGMTLLSSDNVSVSSINPNIVLPDLENDTYMDRKSITGTALYFRVINTNQEVGNDMVNIDNKYKITKLTFGSSISMNLNDLKLSNLITIGGLYFGTSVPRLSGNLTEILKSSKSSIKNIHFKDSMVVGSPNDLGECSSLINLAIGTNIQGDWYQFVQMQRNYRADAEIKIVGYFKGAFNGHQIDDSASPELLSSKLSWNTNKSFLLFDETYNVYCIGYTDEEIETNTASGGIWAYKNVTKCD